MIKDYPVQLSLGVSLKDDATFKNFYTNSDVNNQVIAALLNLAKGQKESNNHFVWGSPGAGLTHLLQALCHSANKNGMSIQYLPINDILGFEPADICEGLEGVDIICIDGLDLICGYRQWERELFNLFNNVKDEGNVIVFASHTSPQTLPILLADLKSRLLSCTIYHVEGLKDEEKQQALRMRATSRGMEMSEEVAKFILSRASRDTNELFFLLNRLDEASLREKRRLTIPFVKEVLGF